MTVEQTPELGSFRIRPWTREVKFTLSRFTQRTRAEAEAALSGWLFSASPTETDITDNMKPKWRDLGDFATHEGAHSAMLRAAAGDAHYNAKGVRL